MRGLLPEVARETWPADPGLHHAGRPAAARRGPGHGGPHRGRGRLRLHRGHGPLFPDPRDRRVRARDARGIHDARLPGRVHLEGRAAHAGHRRHLPAARHPRQDRDDAGRAVRRAGLARHRRGVERGGVARARHPVPAGRRAVRAARGNPADLPADVARRREPVPRRALHPGAAAELAAVPDQAAPADHDRRRGRTQDAAAGRQVRRRVQPVPDPGPGAQAGRAARALRRRGPRLRRDHQDLLLRLRRRREGREGRRGGRPARRHGRARLPGRAGRRGQRLAGHPARGDRRRSHPRRSRHFIFSRTSGGARPGPTRRSGVRDPSPSWHGG